MNGFNPDVVVAIFVAAIIGVWRIQTAITSAKKEVMDALSAHANDCNPDRAVTRERLDTVDHRLKDHNVRPKEAGA